MSENPYQSPTEANQMGNRVGRNLHWRKLTYVPAAFLGGGAATWAVATLSGAEQIDAWTFAPYSAIIVGAIAHYVIERFRPPGSD